MANVVRQCPFQCFSCRFYCNTEDTFLRHWRSELHAKTLEQISGSYRCTPCDFWCEENEAMECHLLDPSHRDVVSMMNGSVPIMIGRQRGLPCAGCDRRFRYNLQLRIHAKETGHEESLTASDEYQQRMKCKLCPRVVRSLVALQRHQLSCHAAKTAKGGGEGGTAPPFCPFCSMNFATAREAVLHRRTSSHKEVVKARKSSGGATAAATIGRQGPHCEEKQANLSDHKSHLLDRHPELCYRCPRCGTLFALSQDVTRHTRENKCQEEDEGTKAKGGEGWRCGECSFSTDSRSEFIFHEALHAGPVNPSGAPERAGPARPLAKYSCPVGKRAFAKVSLRNHIRSHTGERPFPCAKCLAPFSRRSDLNAHQKECTGSSGWPDGGSSGRKRGFACSECNNAFYTKHSLRQHMLRHAGKKYKCGLPGCPTVLRTASELRSHVSLVHDATPSTRRYKCSDCTYAAKTRTQLRRHRARHDGAENATKSDLRPCPYTGCAFRTKIASHLQRHVRLHTGTKPYKCRHCSYASNNLENLRKHVLSTNLHPGKTIYECDVCQGNNPEPFRTNFAKELRAHLLEVHSDTFSTPGHANDYVIGIFKVHRSTDFVDEPN
ncbi:zinc finger protein 845-like [Apis dorsata]|uniref:zinc finger protein 845-like n=1 Tax=Apis dorsata TaxID=7462 RepID=UPI0003DF6533|nr:zinc finger protein 845-like [Apis dorsata]